MSDDVVPDPHAPNPSVQQLVPLHVLYACTSCRWSIAVPAGKAAPICERCGNRMDEAKGL